MIEIEDLTKDFGDVRAVDNLSLHVPRGEVLGFLGPNGAGKSTTMKMVTGFLRPSSGTARICGHDIVSDRLAAQRRIGYLPEGAPAWPEMTVVGLVRFAGRARGMHGATLSDAIGHAVNRTGLQDVVSQPVETLSKGYRRRVGLAQALLHDPDVLILDEPTDGLDPNQKHVVRELISEIAANKAIIISTHILEEVEALCSRAVIVSNGRIVADGTPAELEARDPLAGAVRITLTPADVGDARIILAETFGGDAISESDANELLVRTGDVDVTMISEALRDAKVTPLGFRPVRGRLDTVFRSITGNGSEASSI